MNDTLDLLHGAGTVDASIEHTTEPFYLRERSTASAYQNTPAGFADWDVSEAHGYDIILDDLEAGVLLITTYRQDACEVVHLEANATTCCLDCRTERQKDILAKIIGDYVSEHYEHVTLTHTLGRYDILLTTISASRLLSTTDPKAVSAEQADLAGEMLSALDLVRSIFSVAEELVETIELIDACKAAEERAREARAQEHADEAEATGDPEAANEAAESEEEATGNPEPADAAGDPNAPEPTDAPDTDPTPATPNPDNEKETDHA